MHTPMQLYTRVCLRAIAIFCPARGGGNESFRECNRNGWLSSVAAARNFQDIGQQNYLLFVILMFTRPNRPIRREALRSRNL
jgi:hypothetical protein